MRSRSSSQFSTSQILSKTRLFSALLSSLILAACGNDSTSSSTPVDPATAARALQTSPSLTPPPLETPVEILEAALKCSESFGPNSGRAVLFVPGATQTVESNFSWNYLPAMDKAGISWCAIDLPFSNTGELQIASEYITHAIRKMFSTTGTKIAIVGFSQGGVMPRWSLKYFPDTRGMVEDMIGIAAANHGLIETNLLCAPPVIGCITSFTQIAVGAKWLDALNIGGETFKGIDYTQIYTRTDDVAVPNFDEANGVSSLRTGEGNKVNIATQDVCITNVADHFVVGSFDPVSYAIVKDALDHPGTASLDRVAALAPGLCLEPAMPGANPMTFPIDFASKMMSTFAQSVSLQPKSTSEPALKCYAGGDCI